MAAVAILNFKNFNFWSRDCHWTVIAVVNQNNAIKIG